VVVVSRTYSVRGHFGILTHKLAVIILPSWIGYDVTKFHYRPPALIDSQAEQFCKPL